MRKFSTSHTIYVTNERTMSGWSIFETMPVVIDVTEDDVVSFNLRVQLLDFLQNKGAPGGVYRVCGVAYCYSNRVLERAP